MRISIRIVTVPFFHSSRTIRVTMYTYTCYHCRIDIWEKLRTRARVCVCVCVCMRAHWISKFHYRGHRAKKLVRIERRAITTSSPTRRRYFEMYCQTYSLKVVKSPRNVASFSSCYVTRGLPCNRACFCKTACTSLFPPQISQIYIPSFAILLNSACTIFKFS